MVAWLPFPAATCNQNCVFCDTGLHHECSNPNCNCKHPTFADLRNTKFRAFSVRSHSNQVSRLKRLGGKMQPKPKPSVKSRDLSQLRLRFSMPVLKSTFAINASSAHWKIR